MPDENRAASHFHTELRLLLTRFRKEYTLTYSEAIGVLEKVKNELLMEWIDEEDYEDYEGDD